MAKKGKTLKIQGTSIELKFGMNTLVTIEELIDKPFQTLLTEGFTMKDFRSVIQACMLDKKPDTTPTDAGNALDEILEHIGMDELATLVGEGMVNSMGKMPTTNTKSK